MSSAMVLYCFLFFGCPGLKSFLSVPMNLANMGKKYLSARYAKANPAAASACKKAAKSEAIGVRSIKLINHFAGSRSMYNEISSAATIVTQKGTFVAMDCRNGGPMLRTTLERVYW